MGKTLDNVLFASADLILRADDEINRFYDTRGKTPLREAAKHLVPMYTSNKVSNLGVADSWVSLMMILEIGKMASYGFLIGYGINLIK